MILLHGSVHSTVLHFPAEYDLALPNSAAKGQKCPLAVLLHDLGKGREQWLYSTRLESITEEFQMALLLPEGRRSCFLNMDMGPCWENYLKEELLPNLSRQLGVSAFPEVVVGIGSGALGALQLCTETGASCAVIDPDFTSPFEWHADIWPKQKEWQAVFGNQKDCWQPGRFANVKGTVIGLPAASEGFLSAFGLKDWQIIDLNTADLEQKLQTALRACKNK